MEAMHEAFDSARDSRYGHTEAGDSDHADEDKDVNQAVDNDVLTGAIEHALNLAKAIRRESIKQRDSATPRRATRASRRKKSPRRGGIHQRRNKHFKW
jgi:hypothetical protein